jgi:formylglycine-generating enzyme required for sulfatase activity
VDAQILAQAKAGDLRTADVGGGILLKLCGVPAGTVTIGGSNMRQVTMKNPFWLGQTQVTQGQWQALMRNNPSKFKGDNLPVEQVSWDEAAKFCDRLNALHLLPSGWQFGMPTVLQWEHACRAGTSGDYAGTLSEMAWYSDNSQHCTHNVATKKANSWGLYDMHGNVWEWCADNNQLRESRGGSWNSGGKNCSSTADYRHPPDARRDFLGFRVAIFSAVI